MAEHTFGGVLRHLRRLAEPRAGDDARDGELLSRFAAGRDEAAFAALVRRHGPMVLAVCRRVLRHADEAEDAFQATFLVLVRKAGALRDADQVGSWLYGVAYRTAVRARAGLARRRSCEGEARPGGADDPLEDVDRRDLRRALDEELGRLPERYRAPLVLCYLEGLSHAEAARRLGCPQGTVETRLARGRDRLRGRLTRRGLGVAAGSLAALLESEAVSAAVPPALVESTARACMAFAAGPAAGGMSGPAVLLAHEVLKTMFVTRMTAAAAVGMLLVLGVAGSGMGLVAQQATEADGPAARGETTTPLPVETRKAKSKERPALPAAPGVTERTAVEPATAIREKLSSPVERFPGHDDPKTTLQEALQGLQDRHQVAFDINESAFQAENVNDVLATAIAERPVPEMRNVPLALALEKILARVPSPSGVMYVVRPGRVEVTTKAAVRAETGVPEDQALLPLVITELDKQPLESALRELADLADYNVVLDVRAGEKAKTQVSARLNNVPLDQAVRLLADMADLKAVAVGNVLYVTSRENAGRMEAEEAKRRAAMAEAKPEKKEEKPPADGKP